MPLLNLNRNNNSNPQATPQSAPVQSYSDINSKSYGIADQQVMPQNQVREITNSYPPAPQPKSTDISVVLDNKIKSMNMPVEIDQQPNVAQAALPNTSSLENKFYTLDQIILEAITLKASDIHLSVGNRAIVRVDGGLRSISSQVLTNNHMVAYAKEFIKGRLDIDLGKITQVDLGYTFKDRRLRVNIFRAMGNISVACRIIPNKISTIEELDLPPILKDFTSIGSGLILVTGPTGSGKSTTISALLNHINLTQPKHIVTLEDPIEFVFPKGQSLIEQREFINDFDSWDGALKSILRQDPNVVLVGEMRDIETIASTVTISETGHLVFATLHTNSASQTIDRIIDVFPESKQSQIRAQLANVLTAIISQRLVPLSFGGRKAAVEILVATSAVKNAIREGKTYQIDNMIQTSQDVGMITMEKSLVEMVRKQEISVDTAKSYSIKPDEIDLLLRGK